MANIRLSSKNKFLDIINATSLFIDSVTPGLGAYVFVFYENGGKEKQEIVSGSKFVQGQQGQKIERVEFHNPSVLSCDISYHYSLVYGYDEARVIGEIDALTRWGNSTLNGGEYAGGFLTTQYPGNYSHIAYYNPVGSGVITSIKVARISAFGAGVQLKMANATIVSLLAYTTNMRNKDYSLPDGKTEQYGGYGSTNMGSTDIKGKVPTDASGTPTSLDMHSAPIVLREGYGLILTPAVVDQVLAAYVELDEVIAV